MVAIGTARRRTLSPIGIDLGLTGARLAQLRRVEGTWVVERLVRWGVPATAGPEDGETSLEEIARLAARLRRVLHQGDFAGTELTVGLSQPDLELHPLELPERGDGEVERQMQAAARWEVERLSRFPEGTTESAHWRLPASRRTRTTAMGVAVPSTRVRAVWDMCRSAGGDCRRIDAAACALSRAAVLLRRPREDEVWAVLDVGARATRLILCVDEVPVLARSLGPGGQAWSKRIAEALHLSEESAELHKCDQGIRFSGPSRGDPPAAGADARRGGGAPLAELAGLVFSALRVELERIADEIIRSYEYVMQCYPGRKAADLILAGAGSCLTNFDTFLAERLGVPACHPQTYVDQGRAGLRLSENAGQRVACREALDGYLGAVGLCLPPEGWA